MRSSLKPGKVPQAIASLRSAAIAESEKPERGRYVVRHLSFDKPMENNNEPGTFRQDDNTIAKFPGLVSPHVGNGKGAAK